MTRRAPVFLAASCLAACGGYEVDDWGTAREPLNCPGNALAVGIDSVVNSACSGMNWSQFKAGGGSFALIKAGEGDWNGTSGWQYVNPNFPSAWPAMRQAGVIRGAFSYFHPDLDGARQAQYLYNVINQYGGLQPGDLPPEMDLEQYCPSSYYSVCPSNTVECCQNVSWTGSAWSCTSCVGQSGWVSQATAQQNANAFMNEIQALTGTVPIVYTYSWYWTSYFGAPPSWSQYPVWFASCPCGNCNTCSTCPASNTPPTPPAPWSRATFWQYNWDATNSPGLAGVPAGCADTSAFNGTPADLVAWADSHGPATDAGSVADSGSGGDGGTPRDGGIVTGNDGGEGDGGRQPVPSGCGCSAADPLPVAPWAIVVAAAGLRFLRRLFTPRRRLRGTCG